MIRCVPKASIAGDTGTSSATARLRLSKQEDEPGTARVGRDSTGRCKEYD